MKRATILALSLVLLGLAAMPAAAQSADENATDRCVGKFRLRGPIYDYQNGSLQPGMADLLDGVAKAFLANCPDDLLIIEVHASEMPTPELNQRLSELRAHTIRYELARRGIAESQTMPAGMGSTKPLVPATDPEALQENRRVTFRVAR